MSAPILNPYPIFLDLKGMGLSGGTVYIGLVGQDPIAHPQAVYWDSGLSIPASQPLAVTGGYISNAGSPAAPYTLGSYSIKVFDSQGVLVFYNSVVAPTTPIPLWDYIAGLGGSVGGGNSLSVSPGQCADVLNNVILSQLGTLTKTTAAWAQGNNQGGLDAGIIQPNTWYHWYLIGTPAAGFSDLVFSTNPSQPAMGSGRAPNAYYRRIFSRKTDGSSNWTPVVQRGDSFLWVTMVDDVINGAIGTTTGPINLSVPPGIQVDAIICATVVNPSFNVGMLLTSPDQGDIAAAYGRYTQCSVAASVAGGSGPARIRTNTSAQIRGTCTVASSTFSIATQGWFDSRGKDQ